MVPKAPLGPSPSAASTTSKQRVDERAFHLSSSARVSLSRALSRRSCAARLGDRRFRVGASVTGSKKSKSSS
eukprot:14401113-Heterocapsa_arctica.AAC.1